jgi:hypothetical protein
MAIINGVIAVLLSSFHVICPFVYILLTPERIAAIRENVKY